MFKKATCSNLFPYIASFSNVILDEMGKVLKNVVVVYFNVCINRLRETSRNAFSGYSLSRARLSVDVLSKKQGH